MAAVLLNNAQKKKLCIRWQHRTSLSQHNSPMFQQLGHNCISGENGQELFRSSIVAVNNNHSEWSSVGHYSCVSKMVPEYPVFIIANVLEENNLHMRTRVNKLQSPSGSTESTCMTGTKYSAYTAVKQATQRHKKLLQMFLLAHATFTKAM